MIHILNLKALLYGARGGIATAVSPYTLNAYSDDALKTSKLLLVSKGGHNNDIVFAAKRGLAVNPAGTASFTLSIGERNEVRKLFLKSGSTLSFDIPGLSVHDAFISTQTPVTYLALLCRVFDPGVDLSKYQTAPKVPYRLERNDGTPLTPTDFQDVRSFVVLHGSWGSPSAANLEGKLVESGLCPACVVTGTNWESPKNPGKIDKRQPMWVPFMAEMKRTGPLTL